MISGKEAVEWIKNHRTELLVAGVSIVGTVYIYKNWDDLQDIFKTSTPMLPPAIPTIESSQTVSFPTDLTGNMLTATGLGQKAVCSAQAINQRIVDCGFAKRLPCGEYVMTEAGKMYGQDTMKTTKAGHTFKNIEWDESILKQLFTPDELNDIV